MPKHKLAPGFEGVKDNLWSGLIGYVLGGAGLSALGWIAGWWRGMDTNLQWGLAALALMLLWSAGLLGLIRRGLRRQGLIATAGQQTVVTSTGSGGEAAMADLSNQMRAIAQSTTTTARYVEEFQVAELSKLLKSFGEWLTKASAHEASAKNGIDEALQLVIREMREQFDILRREARTAIPVTETSTEVRTSEPKTEEKPEPLAYHESVQQLLQIYPTCVAAANCACEFFSDVIIDYGGTTSMLTQTALLVDLARVQFEEPCRKAGVELSRLMQKRSGLTERELSERVDQLLKLTGLYWQLLKIILQIGFVVEGKEKIPSELKYKRLYEKNAKLVSVLELIQHRTDIGSAAGHLDTLRSILPLPIEV